MATEKVNTPITRRSVLMGAAALVATAAAAAAPLPLEEWSFEVGQLVSHRDQPMLSEIVGRVRTTKGREIYSIRRLADVPIAYLMILGEVLVPVNDEDAIRSAEAAWARGA
ncbi:hypothetical protein [Mesorhizobium sp. M1322]|uniref:hypothetical protein n=1 Tax=Mesorhizobium sp. M1322 TaxID=2957081 RepID=UPI003336A8A0